jgi:glycosyltransferase EpsF
MSEPSQKPVKVLQVTDTLGMGGAETWLMEALRRWSGGGRVAMDFLLTSGNRGLFDEEAESLGAKLHYLQYSRRTMKQFSAGLSRIMAAEKYDVIHDHQDYASGWHYLMAKKCLPARRVTHVHNPSYQIKNNYGVTFARRMTARVGKWLVGRYATHITGTSRQILGEWGFNDRRFRKIPKAALHCGFRTERFVGDTTGMREEVLAEFGFPTDSKIVLMAGRIDQSPEIGHSQNHKNTRFAVEVVLEALKRDSTIRAVFIGKESPALPELEARIAAAGCTGKIVFPGVRKDPEKYMLAADTLLFPARGEGLGMVAVEAQCSGLPVLASTAVPAECVVDPKLVQFLDLTEPFSKWADVLLALTASPRDMEAGHRSVRASAFSIENSTAALEALYCDGVLPGGSR